MTARAKLITRIAAKLEGEVSAQTAEAYHRAGADAYDLLVECEQRRSAEPGQGQTSWLEDRAACRMFLCTWCAFALQSLGDAFLDADCRANPRTAGFVPPVTARQVLLFYEEVEPWLGRARAAQSSERFALDVRLPARLPGWVDVEPCPREHLAAMRDACWLLCDHAELAVADLERAAGTERADAVGRVREALAQTTSAADYAARLHADTMTPELHRRTEATIKRAYRIGQLAAMPDLADHAATPVRPPAPASRALTRGASPTPTHARCGSRMRRLGGRSSFSGAQIPTPSARSRSSPSSTSRARPARSAMPARAASTSATTTAVRGRRSMRRPVR
ncbi:MAG: hypothetical protein ACR2NR_17145 [Solirubrobacteraceae bacterium]